VIYFVQAGGPGGPIKIGFTACSVGGRIRETQPNCPDRLSILLVLPGSLNGEARAQWRLRASHRLGPWFNLTPQVRAFIEGKLRSAKIRALTERERRDAKPAPCANPGRSRRKRGLLPSLAELAAAKATA
jgi:hypothetical protein